MIGDGPSSASGRGVADVHCSALSPDGRTIEE
jgi:hypothetical protein